MPRGPCPASCRKIRSPQNAPRAGGASPHPLTCLPQQSERPLTARCSSRLPAPLSRSARPPPGAGRRGAGGANRRQLCFPSRTARPGSNGSAWGCCCKLPLPRPCAPASRRAVVVKAQASKAGAAAAAAAAVVLSAGVSGDLGRRPGRPIPGRIAAGAAAVIRRESIPDPSRRRSSGGRDGPCQRRCPRGRLALLCR